jgi:hypothetical protein
MIVAAFTPDRADEWDALVAAAPMGTFLHTRRFLSYHGDRFADASLLLADERGTVQAVLPAAIDPADPRRVVSHPGATYGGLVHDGELNGERAVDALRAVCDHYAERGHAVLRYKPVPHIYHRSPSQDDIWALGELGAVRAGCDLSCAIDLAARRPPSARRVRSLAKARREDVQVSEDAGALPALWAVLEATLERRHGARPVHSIEEIVRLNERFPDAIRPVVALLDGEVVAGAVLFGMATVVHTQYLAATEAGAATSALDAVIDRSIAYAREAGARYFDFGISPGPGRRGLSPGLYRWKAEFGGGGVLYEQYEQPLGAPGARV